MASLTIRNIEEPLKARLRVQAAQNGQSMEEEARQILRGALLPGSAPSENLADAMLRLFGPENGVDLDIPSRRLSHRDPPSFDE